MLSDRILRICLGAFRQAPGGRSGGSPATASVPEGRISHLKHRHGLRRSRLQGGGGERTWTAWAVFADNVETYARYACAKHQDIDKKTETERRSPCSSYFPRRPGPACRGRIRGSS